MSRGEVQVGYMNLKAIFVCLKVYVKLCKGRRLAGTTKEMNVGKIHILTARALLISIS